MKKTMLWMLIVAVIGTTACAGGNTGTNTGNGNTVEDNKNIEETKKDDNSNNQEQEEENTQQGSVKILVYYPNENADGTDTEEMECKELSPENVWNLLKEKEVVAADADINSFRESDKALELDVNETFGEQLRSYGTAGETMLMESVVNTFLDAYGKEAILITENGGTLISGHREYGDYLEKYK